MIWGYNDWVEYCEKAKQWTRYNEAVLRNEICAKLLGAGIPYLREYRLNDPEHTGAEFRADIAVFSQDGEPLIALEIKNKVKRHDEVRGLGQTLIYKYAGFPRVGLIMSCYHSPFYRAVAESAGIDLIEPWNSVAWIKTTYTELGAEPKVAGAGVICRPPKNMDYKAVYERKHGKQFPEVRKVA